MRALVMIHPPEIGPALAAGLKDASSEIRKVASAGLMKAAAIPPEVVPGLTDALRDPEVQVRANAAHALARLDVLPADSVAALIDSLGPQGAGWGDALKQQALLEEEPALRDSLSRLIERLESEAIAATPTKAEAEVLPKTLPRYDTVS